MDSFNPLEGLMLDSLASLIWPFCRVSGTLMTMMVISGTSVPTRVRAMLALAITICMLPSIPAVSASELQPFSVAGFLVTINEVLIGAAMGFMTQYLSQVFVIAGQTVAMQTGLGFASMVDPVSGTNAPIVGQFFTILTTLSFFAVDGHLLLFKMIVLSFETLPISVSGFEAIQLTPLISFGSTMFMCGIAMAMSSICTMLVVNFTFGVMTRAAPQLNVFSMGFAVSMVVGLFVLAGSINAYPGNFYNAANQIFEAGCHIIGTSCDGPF